MNLISIGKQKINARLKFEAFFLSTLSIIISPTYIVRSGLYRGVTNFAQRFEGDVLDFGCGSKSYETLFTKAKSYIGIDIEVSGYSHKDNKVDFYYDGKSLSFPDNSFDCIVCFEILEHVFNIEEGYVEIFRVLKPNGLFLGTLPVVWEEYEVAYDFAKAI